MAKVQKKQAEPQEEQFSLYSLLNPAIIAISAIVLLLTSIAVTSALRKKDNNIMDEPAPKEQLMILPQGWEKVTKEGYENTYIKKTDNENDYTPTVAYDRNSVKESDAGDYFAKMIAGAKSAIPSLVITSNEQTQYEGFDVLNLAGNYFQGGTQIEIRQRLFLNGTTLHTIAASYADGQEISEEEIDAVFDYIVQNYIKK